MRTDLIRNYLPYDFALRLWREFPEKLFFLPVLFLILGCADNSNSDVQKGDIAAKVYDRTLYFSDIKIDFPQEISDKNRSNLINSYIEHWVRKEILAHDAAKRIEDFNRINSLVEDYKNSLIIDDFKNKYISDNLDSTITEQDLNKFYSENKHQFILDHPVVNIIYAKFKDDKHNLDKFYENWKKKRFRYISDYCAKNSDEYLYKKDVWYDLDDVKKTLPSFLRKKKDSYEVQINKKGYEYFLKVFDTKHKNENIPLNIVKKDIEKLILQKRKSDLIDKYIEELYKKEIDSDKIKIYR